MENGQKPLPRTLAQARRRRAVPGAEAPARGPAPRPPGQAPSPGLSRTQGSGSGVLHCRLEKTHSTVNVTGDAAVTPTEQHLRAARDWGRDTAPARHTREVRAHGVFPHLGVEAASEGDRVRARAQPSPTAPRTRQQSPRQRAGPPVLLPHAVGHGQGHGDAQTPPRAKPMAVGAAPPPSSASQPLTRKCLGWGGGRGRVECVVTKKTSHGRGTHSAIRTSLAADRHTAETRLGPSYVTSSHHTCPAPGPPRLCE